MAESQTVQIHSLFLLVFTIDKGPGSRRPGRPGPSKEDAAPELDTAHIPSCRVCVVFHHQRVAPVSVLVSISVTL